MAATHMVQGKDASLPVEGGMYHLADQFERRNWAGLAGPYLPPLLVSGACGVCLSALLSATS